MHDIIMTDWGPLDCEPGAFAGVPSRIRDNVALHLAQREWVEGKMVKPISRLEVTTELRKMAARIRPHYHTWESDAASEAAALKKALEALGA